MKKLAMICKALGDETRLEIVHMLSDQELCVCKIMDEFRFSQPTISHHLKILKQAGIINDRKEGKWVFYSINEAIFPELVSYIDAIHKTKK